MWPQNNLSKRTSARLLPIALVWVLLSISSLISSAVSADGSEAMKSINDANTAYERGEFRRALNHYRRAYLLTEDSRVLYRIGITFENLANYQRAREHLQQYLVSEPTSKYGQRVRKKIENLRKLEKTLQAGVRISSVPSGAKVFAADEPNRPVGFTPVRIPVGPGGHRFKIRLAGYVETTIELEVRAGETIDENVELVELEVVKEEKPVVIVEKPKIETETKPEPSQVSTIYDGKLTYVDVAPPAGVSALLWTAFPIGAALGLVGTIFIATDRSGGAALLLFSTAMVTTSGYFLWVHNWTNRLPDVPATSVPQAVGAGFGMRF